MGEGEREGREPLIPENLWEQEESFQDWSKVGKLGR